MNGEMGLFVKIKQVRQEAVPDLRWAPAARDVRKFVQPMSELVTGGLAHHHADRFEHLENPVRGGLGEPASAGKLGNADTDSARWKRSQHEVSFFHRAEGRIAAVAFAVGQPWAVHVYGVPQLRGNNIAYGLHPCLLF